MSWHDLECGSYRADLPLWRELAAAADGPVLDIGAGTGRVALDLAQAGFTVVALDSEPALLAELRRRDPASVVRTVCADARTFDLQRRFSLIVVPMQTAQLLRGVDALLDRAAAHLEPGGRIAIALAGEVEPFDEGGPALPVPDMREEPDGTVLSSQPVAARVAADGAVTIERVRSVVDPAGGHSAARDVLVLDPLTPAGVEAAGRSFGLVADGTRTVAPTPEHVGSEVVVLRRA